MNEDLALTVGILAALIALFAYASWKAAKPAVFGKARMLPWRSIIVFSGFGSIMALVHLVNLFGITTGAH